MTEDWFGELQDQPALIEVAGRVFDRQEFYAHVEAIVRQIDDRFAPGITVLRDADGTTIYLVAKLVRNDEPVVVGSIKLRNVTA